MFCKFICLFFRLRYDRANSIFWTRALNIPFPRSYVFPRIVGEQENPSFSRNEDSLVQVSGELLSHGEDEKGEIIVPYA